MDIREAFNAIVSMLREYDGNFGRNSSNYVVERNHLRHDGWRVFETAANAEGDYLSEEYNAILTVTRRDNDAYLVYVRPFAWQPQNKYGFTPKMFSYLFRKYDDALVKSCISLAENEGGMLYSEVKNTNGVQRCHYGVKVYNCRTGEWEKVYEGTFKL